MSIRFGTAGISDSFDAMGFKNSLDIPAYIERFQLHAFEYQCGRGVRLGLDKAAEMARRILGCQGVFARSAGRW